MAGSSKQRKPWVARPVIRVGLHLLVLLGLIGALGASVYADRYFNRGVARETDLAPIPYTDVNPLGINTFLHEEPDPAVVERSLDMIAEGGFGTIRQIFPWFEIEPEPGVFIDSTHGAPVSTWAKFDRIIEMANARGIEVIVRLDKPPAWAREGQPNLEQYPDGPPNNNEDYARFVAMVVERYRGQIRFVQIWNEPNLEGEWGGQPIDPAAFTELLRVAYLAAKEANPEIVVLMPGLAPTEQTGPHNLSDLLFLEGMYEAGAADYFDIATVMVYGYGYSPWDRRVSFERNNFSRPIQTREIMVRYGDANKPVWAAEYGWVSLPNDWAGDEPPWGRPVSAEQQADYLYQGYLRAQQEWPWMGVMCVWNFRFTWNTPEQQGNPTRGFSIVEHDFTPRPAYQRLAAGHDRLDRAYTGRYTADSRLIQRGEDWETVEAESRQRLRPVQSGATLEIPFSGQRIDLELAGAGNGFAATIDGAPPEGLPRDAEGRAVVSGNGSVTVAEGLDDQPHMLTLTALGAGEESQVIEGFAVSRRPLHLWIYPWVDAALAGLIVLNLASLIVTVRRQPSVQPSTEPRRAPQRAQRGSRAPQPQAPARVFSAAELRAARGQPRSRARKR